MSRAYLGFYYTFTRLLDLFYRCSVFDQLDNYTHREFLDDESKKEVSKRVDTLMGVFFIHDEEAEEEKKLSKQESADRKVERAMRMAEVMGGEVIDMRRVQ